MRALLAGVAFVTVLPLSPASAAAGPGEGVLCGWTSTPVPLPNGRYRGEVDAGPVVIADGTDPRSGRIRCSIAVNGERHSDPATTSAVSPTMTGVVVLPATPYEYEASPGDRLAFCMRVEIDGAGTFYFDDVRGGWSTDPDASCGIGFVYPLPGPSADSWLHEAVLCPVLASVPVDAGIVSLGPDGDVVVSGGTWWDCPPYEWP